MTTATTTITSATPTKLRSGSWGAKVQDANPQLGQVVRITTKSGKSWLATVTRVIWSGNGVAICATASAKPRQQRSYSVVYCGYPCPVTGLKCCAANGQCHDCL